MSQIKRDSDEGPTPIDGSESAAAAVHELAQQRGTRIHAVNIGDIGEVAMRPTYPPPTEVVTHSDLKEVQQVNSSTPEATSKPKPGTQTDPTAFVGWSK